MQVKYEVELKVTVVHEVSEMEELKTNSELAEDLRAMICDEATVAGGVAVVDILNSPIDVK